MMNPRSVRPVGLLTVSILLGAALSACATIPAGPQVVLPNDYYLQPGQGAQTELVRSGGKRVLATPVAAYAVYGDVVAGAQGDAPAWSAQFTDDRAFTGGADTRYFILHTRSRKLESGLTRAEWRKRLGELGVPADFRIYPLPPWNPRSLEAAG